MNLQLHRIFQICYAAEEGAGASAPTIEAPAVEGVAAPPSAVETGAEGAASPAPNLSEAPAVEAPASPAPDTKSESTLLGGKDAPATSEAPKAEGEVPVKDAPVEAQPLAPIAYEPFKAPEGFALDETIVKDFAELIGKDRLPQETAQALIDRHFAEVSKVQQQNAAAQADAWRTHVNGLKEQAKADPVIGGAKLEENVMLAERAMSDAFPKTEDRKAFVERLVNSGMANDPYMIRMLSSFAKSKNLVENGIVTPSPAAPSGKRGSPGSGDTGWYGQST